jgi:hypothetical protein
VIYSYNKSQQGALFLNFILVNNSTCFGQTLLSIIRSLNTIFTAVGICHTEILKFYPFLKFQYDIPIAVNTVLRLLMMSSNSVRNI